MRRRRRHQSGNGLCVICDVSKANIVSFWKFRVQTECAVFAESTISLISLPQLQHQRQQQQHLYWVEVSGLNFKQASWHCKLHKTEADICFYLILYLLQSLHIHSYHSFSVFFANTQLWWFLEFSPIELWFEWMNDDNLIRVRWHDEWRWLLLTGNIRVVKNRIYICVWLTSVNKNI